MSWYSVIKAFLNGFYYLHVRYSVAIHFFISGTVFNKHVFMVSRSTTQHAIFMMASFYHNYYNSFSF